METNYLGKHENTDIAIKKCGTLWARIYEIIQLLLSSGGGLLTFSISAIRRSKTLPKDEKIKNQFIPVS
jgi:hypothetical protein